MKNQAWMSRRVQTVDVPVCGGSVKPGLYGKQPPLDRLDAGDLFYNVDFRSVYSTILSQWMKAPAAQVLGRDFPKLNLI